MVSIPADVESGGALVPPILQNWQLHDAIVNRPNVPYALHLGV